MTERTAPPSEVAKLPPTSRSWEGRPPHQRTGLLSSQEKCIGECADLTGGTCAAPPVRRPPPVSEWVARATRTPRLRRRGEPEQQVDQRAKKQRAKASRVQQISVKVRGNVTEEVVRNQVSTGIDACEVAHDVDVVLDLESAGVECEDQLGERVRGARAFETVTERVKRCRIAGVALERCRVQRHVIGGLPES